MQDIDWDEIRFILAVSRGQSFAGAAKLLRVDETTVSRRIGRFEEKLQATLFERSGGRLLPTEAGTEMVRHAEKIEFEVQAACESITGTDVRISGLVRITSVPWIINRVLAPALPDFSCLHPHLNIELIADFSDLSLMRRETDIALRLSRPQQEMRALAHRVGTVRYGVFASRHMPSSRMTWITYAENMYFLPQSKWISEQVGRDKSMLSQVCVNDAETLLQAVKAGSGKSFLPISLCENDPDLIRLDEGLTVWQRELWMMVHPEQRKLARMNTTINWLDSIIGNQFGNI